MGAAESSSFFVGLEMCGPAVVFDWDEVVFNPLIFLQGGLFYTTGI
ncbi:hypothetical protein J2736_006038 [Paenibacillus qinlingensis]|uniref:Uncharacterized protein n=1 Tax=Paenibacillus qinlingensis TaxID=1837343 RepID=A0ABU1P6K3_9BACL|nr:hypothetical protein [Paenibacillus qinlingensis]